LVNVHFVAVLFVVFDFGQNRVNFPPEGGNELAARLPIQPVQLRFLLGGQPEGDALPVFFVHRLSD
jgi:hypothetical protein